MKYLISLILICLCVTVSARLHETSNTCQTRYGKPLSVKVTKHMTTRTYIVNNYYYIKAKFYKDKCFNIVYSTFVGTKTVHLNAKPILKTLGYDNLRVTSRIASSTYYRHGNTRITVMDKFLIISDKIAQTKVVALIRGDDTAGL